VENRFPIVLTSPSKNAREVVSCSRSRLWLSVKQGMWNPGIVLIYNYTNLVPRASVWGRGETRGSPGLGRSILHTDWLTPEEVGQLIRRIWANLSTNQIAPFSSCSHEAFGIENLHIFLEISRDTTFTTVNLPIGTVSWKVSVLTSHFRRYAVAM
jgi:hypothetical protein